MTAPRPTASAGTIIDRIKEKLSKYPACHFFATATSLNTEPDVGGFSVGLQLRDGEVVVNFDGWHEHFADENAALNCFAFGLSDACRLEVVMRGNSPTSWTMQSKKDGAWVSDSTTGLLLVPFWRARSVRHLQNRVIVGSGDEGS